MSSGTSYTGGISRCFAYWQEFSKCYAGADLPRDCAKQLEDYYECMHHKKEIARTKAIREELNRRIEQEIKDGVKAGERGAGGLVVGLGLIKKEVSAEGDTKS